MDAPGLPTDNITSETGPCSPNERGPYITEDDGELAHDEESPHGVGLLEDDGAVPEETQAAYVRPIRPRITENMACHLRRARICDLINLQPK
nr:unnamed protein product [Spirometra erinaceieuropaei]